MSYYQDFNEDYVDCDNCGQWVDRESLSWDDELGIAICEKCSTSLNAGGWVSEKLSDQEEKDVDTYQRMMGIDHAYFMDTLSVLLAEEKFRRGIYEYNGRTYYRCAICGNDHLTVQVDVIHK